MESHIHIMNNGHNPLRPSVIPVSLKRIESAHELITNFQLAFKRLSVKEILTDHDCATLKKAALEEEKKKKK